MGDCVLISAPSALVTSHPRALLQARNLTVQYSAEPQSHPALYQINLDIQQGEVVGILGESGCGKTTLALSILGLLPANARAEGSIFFQGEDLLRNDEAHWNTIRGAKISMIFQEPELCLSPVMRVGDQITEVLRAHGHGGRDQRKRECRALLASLRFLDVNRVCNAYPCQLSGGELHRVAIAQALACRPDLVIADETTRSLDVSIQADILNVLRGIKQKNGTAFIFITHNPALLVGFADRVIAIGAGRIVEQGSLASLLRSPNPYIRGLLGLSHRQRDPHPRPHLKDLQESSTDLHEMVFDAELNGCNYE